MPRFSMPFKDKMKENMSKPNRSSDMKPDRAIPMRSKAKDERDSNDNIVTFSYRRKSKIPNGSTIKNVNIHFNEDTMKVMNVQATETHIPKQSGPKTTAPTKPIASKLPERVADNKNATRHSPMMPTNATKLPERIADNKNATRHSTMIPTNARSTRNNISYDHHGRDIDAISNASLVSELDCARHNSLQLCSSLSLLNMIGSDNSEQIVGCGNIPVTPVSRTESLVTNVSEVQLPSIIDDSSVGHNYSHRLRSATKHRLPLFYTDGYTSSDNTVTNKPIIRKRKRPIKKCRKRKVNTKKGVKLRTNTEATISDENAPSPNVPVIAEIHQIPLLNSNHGLENSELGTNNHILHNSGFESTSGNSEYYAPRLDKSLSMQRRSFITAMKESLHSFEKSVGKQINLHANRLEQISGEREQIFRTICDLEQKLMELRSKFLANMNEAELCSSNLVDVMAKHSEKWERIKDQTSKKWFRVHQIYSSDIE